MPCNKNVINKQPKTSANVTETKLLTSRESLKQNYYRSKFENCRNGVKKTWKVINEIISTITIKTK